MLQGPSCNRDALLDESADLLGLLNRGHHSTLLSRWIHRRLPIGLKETFVVVVVPLRQHEAGGKVTKHGFAMTAASAESTASLTVTHN